MTDFNKGKIVYSDRGFAQYFEFDDLYKAKVRVVESSLATQPAVWIFTKGGGVTGNDGSIHLGITELEEMLKCLKHVLKEMKK